MKATASLLLTSLILLTGCSTVNQSTKVLEAEQRVVTGVDREELLGKQLHTARIVCPEPSPDALKTFALSGTASKGDIAALSAAYQQSGANIGLRTQSIQLLRDQLFAYCQAYANGAITAEMYQMYMARNQRNTVATLAIEQLTGAIKSPDVVLTSQSSTADSKYLLDQAALIKDAKEKLAKMTAGSDEAKTMQSNIEAMQAQLKQAQQSMVQAGGSGTSVTLAQPPLPAEGIKSIADRVWDITATTAWSNDLFYICMNAYANLPPNKRQPEFDAACAKIYDNLAKIHLFQLKQITAAANQAAQASSDHKRTTPNSSNTPNANSNGQHNLPPIGSVNVGVPAMKKMETYPFSTSFGN
ncbi:hypothetical protein [Pseudomonas oryzihabitans]|uniref:hypothetical protein n=1 Tax=Pseudomonas oryzihabitans TaxID=47885 RepID=UPI001121FBB4|nr:hypothetical protein [Pseudomonas psychrotolerans]QDD89708.1 hypothetical protein CCZ28_12045 [Pseudomonas psychrotolerans]